MVKRDDIYYIKKVINGHTNYFSYLVERYKDIVFSIALKVLKNREEAEEAAQETFIKAFKSLHTYRAKAKFSTWLFRIAYNTCISEIRKKKPESIPLYDIQVRDESEEIDFDEFPEKDREKYVKTALKQLADDEYTLVLLYYYEDESIEGISKITGLTVSNVKVKLHRARKKLYAILSEMLNDKLYTIL
ncbi:MAG: RNA polymerase sigma factor [Prolixibacteraceae bacterium]|nr:RNA polymerase sigma factor [Prolixibacteraceae bacterium]MDD4754505.1 RNA polymerase sigma factor [Prolixibacteraceae bacterium]